MNEHVHLLSSRRYNEQHLTPYGRTFFNNGVWRRSFARFVCV